MFIPDQRIHYILLCGNYDCGIIVEMPKEAQVEENEDMTKPTFYEATL